MGSVAAFSVLFNNNRGRTHFTWQHLQKLWRPTPTDAKAKSPSEKLRIAIRESITFLEACINRERERKERGGREKTIILSV